MVTQTRNEVSQLSNAYSMKNKKHKKKKNKNKTKQKPWKVGFEIFDL